MIRILVADDHCMVRQGLRRMIEDHDDLTVVAEAADFTGVFKALAGTPVDVAVLDLSMPGLGGIRATEEIRQRCPRTKVLILTMHADVEYVRSAMLAGAKGYLTKTAVDRALLEAIRTVHRGQNYVDPSIGFDLVAEMSAKREIEARAAGARPLLSPREEEVLRLLAQGHTNQGAADQLCVGVKTVETYRARLVQKLRLRRRADLVRYALETGILVPGDSSR